MKTPFLSKVLVFALSVIASTVMATDFDGTADLILVGDETVEFASGTVLLDADRVIELTGTAKTAKIKIGAALASGAVTVKPATTASPDAQLVFDVADSDSVLTVEVLNDLLLPVTRQHQKRCSFHFVETGRCVFACHRAELSHSVLTVTTMVPVCVCLWSTKKSSTSASTGSI